MIKVLDIQYFDKCLEIHNLKKKHGGSAAIDLDYFSEKFYPYFEGNDDRQAIGYFEDNDIVSWLSLNFYESENAGRCWFIPCFYTTKFYNVFSMSRPEIGLLMKSAIQLAESRQYYTYYYAISKKLSTVYQKQWIKNMRWASGRYIVTDFDTVLPNTKPESKLSWRLMGEKLKSETILIKKRKLKKEYHNKPLL